MAIHRRDDTKLSTHFFLRMIWNMAWEREECVLAEVTPDVRAALPCWINRKTSSTVLISSSFKPTIWTCCFASSRTRSFCLWFSRSKTCRSTNKLVKYTIYFCEMKQSQNRKSTFERLLAIANLATVDLEEASGHRQIHFLIFCVQQFKNVPSWNEEWNDIETYSKSYERARRSEVQRLNVLHRPSIKLNSVVVHSPK